MVGIARACKLLGVSASGYYSWLRREARPGAVKECDLPKRIREIFVSSHGIYGSRRIQRVLVSQGTPITRRKVARMMRAQGLIAKAARGRGIRTTDSRHTLPVSPNLPQKDFRARAPNRVWVTDVTYIRTLEGWIYLAIVLDLYARRVVGWTLSEKNDRFLAMDAVRMALRRRKHRKGLIVHSDRGSPYCSFDFQELLRTHGILSGMSAKGDCYDNACAESFFHSLKVEWLDDAPLKSKHDTAGHVIQYVELFYNRVRIHSSLDYLSPCDFESA